MLRLPPSVKIYLASQPGVYREWLIALFPPRHRDLVRDIVRDVADALRGYIVGQLTTMSEEARSAVVSVVESLGKQALQSA